MFKSIIKGVKWFFRQDDVVSTKVSRKHRHAHISAQDVGTKIKVRGYNTEMGEATPSEIIETYRVMTVIAEKKEFDVIEVCKEKMLNPLGLTEDHLKHALQCCGFQKSHRAMGQPVYDPRLLQALRLAVSMHSAQVSIAAKAIVENLDSTLEK